MDSNGLSRTPQSQRNEEMKLQLRDERINLTYLDIFQSDIETNSGRKLVRVFSLGATLLEYMKFSLGIWTFFVSLIVVAFRKVLHPLSGQRALLYADLSADILFALALLVQLRTTILVVETGREFCSSRKIIRAHFCDIRWWMDIVSCVPLLALEKVAPGMRWIALIKAMI